MLVTPKTQLGLKYPTHEEIITPSGRKIIRFSDMNSMLWYDDQDSNPKGLYTLHKQHQYIKNRFSFDEYKQNIYRQAKAELQVDKEFQKLIHKSKSDKRTMVKTKYGGNFLPVDYSRGEEKIFSRGIDGKKASVLNMAFQVGTFVGGNYQKGFVGILKSILAAQALGIRLNIDMFDSDTGAVPTSNYLSQGYIICNVAKSTQKIDIVKILVASHTEFFNRSLFSGYSAQGPMTSYHIKTFINTHEIVKDLSPYYEVIGGNLLVDSYGNTEEGTARREMVNKIIKIAWR